MTTVLVTSPAGNTEGALTLPADIFDAQANIPVMHQVVVAQLAAARAGTHSTKTRGEVSGGGKKPWRQKGTGRARQGSIRSPQFVGGGVSHGPVPHGYAQRTPKKMKAAALRGALSDRARGGKVHVLTAVVDGDAPSTKAATAVLAAIEVSNNVLVAVTRDEVAAIKSLRNVPGVHVLYADQLNTYDVLVSDDVVFTRAALDAFLAGVGAPAAAETAVPGDAKKPAAKQAPAKKAPAKKAPAKKAADASDAAKAPAKKAAAQSDDAAKAPAKKAPAKKTAAKADSKADDQSADAATDADSVTPAESNEEDAK